MSKACHAMFTMLWPVGALYSSIISRHIQEEEILLRKCLHPDLPWMSIEHVLINGGCRKAQPDVDSATLGRCSWAL